MGGRLTKGLIGAYGGPGAKNERLSRGGVENKKAKIQRSLRELLAHWTHK